MDNDLLIIGASAYSLLAADIAKKCNVLNKLILLMMKKYKHPMDKVLLVRFLI